MKPQSKLDFISALWALGSANKELLRACPSHERTKFTLIAGINVLVSFGFGALTWYVLSLLYWHVGIEAYRVWRYVAAVAAFLIVLGLLWAGCRILRVSLKNVRSRDLVQLLGSVLLYFMLLVPITTGLFYFNKIVYELAMENKGILSMVMAYHDYQQITYIVFGWGLLIPGILKLMWSSPNYDALLNASALAESQAPEEATIISGALVENKTRREDISPEDLHLETELQALFDLDPKNINVGRKLIQLRRKMGKTEEILQVFDALISENQGNAELLREKAQVYQDMGDQGRYVKTIEQAERVSAESSFEENIGKKIILKRMQMQDLDFFGSLNWEFNPQVNVLLGKNGYGKTHLLRALVAIMQTEDKISEDFFHNCGRNAMIGVDIQKEATTHTALRKRMVFEKTFGKVPVLAIPDMRYVDKSGETVGAPKKALTDLRRQSAWHFLHEESYEGLILQFLYDLCLDYLDHKSWELPIFKLVEETVAKLTDGNFKFDEIVRQDSASFAIRVITEGNENHPLPIQKASQGTLSVLAMVGLIYKYLKAIYPKTPESELLQQHAIVIIDEIDAHLHPSWQQNILQLFRDTFPNIQFIVTAHSPLVIAGCQKREVAVLRKETAGFVAEVLEDHFIGATSEEIYRRIFEVEEKDTAYLRLNTLYSQKSRIESEIAAYSDRDNLSAEQQQTLRQLQNRLFYLREFEEVKNKKQTDEQLASKYEMLKMETMEMRGRISALKKQIARYESMRLEQQTQIPYDLLRKSIEQYPEQTKPVEALADHLLEAGRTQEAVMILEALHQALPDQIDIIKNLATQYQVVNQYDKAAALLQKARTALPEDPDLNLALERVTQIIQK